MILTIDPGLHTGIAVWRSWGDRFPLTYELYAGGKGSHEDKLYVLQRKFVLMIQEIKLKMHDDISNIFIEGVEHWSGDLKSQTASTRGNLSFLSYMVGIYCAVGFADCATVKIVPARVWKGQMSKKVTTERVFRVNGIKYKSSHVIDAVAMGFALQGIL